MMDFDDTIKAFARVFFGVDLNADNSSSDAEPIIQAYT